MGWAPPYATPDELASYMGDAPTGGDDAELTLAIEAASRSVDRATDRQFGSLDTPQARYYTARRAVIGNHPAGSRRWVIDVDDFATVDGLTVETVGPDGDSYTTITGYLPAPVNALVNGSVWTSLVVGAASDVVPDGRENAVKVTAQFGWPAVPPTIKMATLLQASRLFARRHAPFGILGSPETGGELRLLERLDADLMTSVRPYVKMWGVV